MAVVTAISIRQPWTELILRGRKTIEVRSWQTKHRGELWLHAGSRADTKALNEFCITLDEVALGALVGRCELHACIEFDARTWDSWRPLHLNEGTLGEPRFAWFLRDVIRIEPRPLKGRLGLMRIDALT